MIDINTIIVTASGIVAGFIGAQVGGGGLISLPVLFLIGLNPAVAIGTNRVSAVFLNLSPAIQYWRNKKINLRASLPFAIMALIGSVPGAYIVLNINPDLLKKSIAVLLVLLVFIVLYKKKIGLMDRETKLKKPLFIILMIVMIFLGAYGGAIGIAVTTFMAAVFLLQGFSFIQGMGNALFITTITSIGASIVFMLNHAVVYEFALLQGAGAFVGGWFGSKFAIKKGNKWVRTLFIIIVSVMVLKLLYDIYT